MDAMHERETFWGKICHDGDAVEAFDSRFGWDCIWPIVNENGEYTGKLFDGESMDNSQYSIFDGDKMAVVRI